MHTKFQLPGGTESNVPGVGWLETDNRAISVQLDLTGTSTGADLGNSLGWYSPVIACIHIVEQIMSGRGQSFRNNLHLVHDNAVECKSKTGDISLKTIFFTAFSSILRLLLLSFIIYNL